MTREIAIKIFNEVLLFGKAHCTQAEFKELAEMSIKALEQEPCDCISRARALSDYADWYGCGYSYNTFYNHLKNMPSIQSKTDILDKIRAEIDSYCSDNRDRNDGLYIAMQIIDKYKAESEDAE